MTMKTCKQANVVEQIAKRLNIAISTVYAILADRKSCYASQGLKQQVKKLAAELGYRPNYIAISLKKGKTGTIGLIVSDMHAETTLARLEHMTKLARDDRYHVFFGCSYNNPVLEEELLEEFFYRRVDGIAIAPAKKGVENRFLRKLVEMRFPVMSFTRVGNTDIDYVSTDYFAGGYIAGEHLLKMGYERLGFLGSEIATIAVEERFEGFKRALVDNGCRIDDSRTLFVDTDASIAIEAGSKRLLEAGVDAVFCTNDRVALIFMRKAMEMGKKIPQELGIIGFDDSDIARMCLIPLTSIRQKIAETTGQLYAALKKKIQGEKISCKLRIKPQLIVRESTKRR